MGVLLAILAAACYGAGDFSGGLASKRSHSTSVTAWSMVIGWIIAVPLAFIVPSSGFTWNSVTLGVLTGMAGGIGLLSLYRALAIGTMSIVSPTTAVIAAVVPLAVGLASGDTLTRWGSIGLIFALVAISLVGLGPTSDGSAKRTGLGLAMIAGLGFGGVFVFLGRTADNAGLWPLVAARPVGLLMASVMARSAGVSLVPLRVDRALASVAGVLDMGANALYILARTHTSLSIAAVLTSLYPAATVVLARVVEKERLRRIQVFGLIAAGVALMLLAIPPPKT